MLNNRPKKIYIPISILMLQAGVFIEPILSHDMVKDILCIIILNRSGLKKSTFSKT
jgi:hypothetical protein